MSPRMQRFALYLGLAIALAGCVPMAAPPVASAPRLGPEQVLENFREVIARVEPVAEQLCREQTPDQRCDFAIYVDRAPRSGVNAVDLHPDLTRVFHRELTRLKVMFCGLCWGQDMRGLPFRFGCC